LSAIEALVSALEAKDQYTGGHSRRVKEIALAIGQELGLSAQDMEDLRCGSLLHDIGKIAIPEAVLWKPAPLTDEEREIMRKQRERLVGENGQILRDLDAALQREPADNDDARLRLLMSLSQACGRSM
jgi:response regulator RpfG family c-di-GMP phosphodiesterase